jgi:hypothetical protein
MKSKIIFTLLVFASLPAFMFLSGCETVRQGEQITLPTETQIKISLLQKITKVSNNSVQLSEVSAIPFAIGEYPIDFVLHENDVFVAENNKGKIYQINIENKEVNDFSANLESRKNLSFPTSIRYFNDKFWVFDNEGLKTFDKEGRKLNLVKVFSSVTHFEISQNETIYANSLTNKSQSSRALIYKINKHGEITGSIGKKESKETDEEAYISLTENLIVSAFRNRPVIHIYDKGSEILVKELNISHPIFAELEKSVANLKEAYKKEGKIFLPRYFAGIKTFRDRLFILLSLPHLEIVELDLQGNELQRYYAKNAEMNLDYFGFDVRSVGEQRQFIVGTMTGINTPNLKLFSYSDKNKLGGT